MRVLLLAAALVLAACESLPPIPEDEDPCAAAAAMARDPHVSSFAVLVQELRCLRAERQRAGE